MPNRSLTHTLQTMIRIVLNPKYEHLREAITQLIHPFRFARGGKVLHDGRNTIKRFDFDGTSLAVKRYGHISMLNKVVYGTLRRSKAERAYLHAAKLRNLGVDTPEEVAYVEERHCGILRASYFISLYSDYRPVMELIEEKAPDADVQMYLFDRLANFIYHIHWAGILHRDLNIGNILCAERETGKFSFQLIDTNRMEFRKNLSMQMRMHNLRRLSCPLTIYLSILESYALIVRVGRDSLQLKGVWYRLLFENRKRFKSRLRTLL